MRRTSEKPLECAPLDASPRTTSPAAMSAARQQAVALGGADREARQIVVALDVHAGHLGRLAAHQRATGAAAAFGDARHDTTTRVHVEPPAGIVVEEEQRLGALDHDVVDAHRHQVDADRVGHARLDRDLELGAHAVGARDEDRIPEARRLEVEQSTEAAQPAHHARPVGAARQGLDVLDQCVARVNVDAGVLVGQGRPIVALIFVGGGVRLQARLIRAR